MLFYEPIFRKAMRRVLTQLAEDGITYVEFRCAFMFEWRGAQETYSRSEQVPSTAEAQATAEQKEKAKQEEFDSFFRAFGEEIQAFQASALGQEANFAGARMIWTIIRRLPNRAIVSFMRACIAMKKAYPHLISGFDFVGQEDRGRTLADLTPLIFWFRKQCVESGAGEIPFFFHAGECLGDGDETDSNLFDALLLGTRRIGHGYSLYKHPLLTEMVKEKKILIESCPISNEILRLSSSILSHALPALLARNVPVSLNNDDPAILGHGRNGLSHDFWQAFMAWENLGLEGLAQMAENGVRWSAAEDQNTGDWKRDVEHGYVGKGIKAKMLKEWRGKFEKWCQWVVLEFAEEDDGSEDEEGEIDDWEEEDDDNGDGYEDEDEDGSADVDLDKNDLGEAGS